MTEIRIIKYGSDEYDDEIALRDRVLRKPLGLKYTPEQLAQEADEVHFNAFTDSKLAGCLLLKRISADEIKMRQVAVDSDLQGTGIGRELVTACEKYAIINNYSIITLHAREAVIQFYIKLGYEICGERFTEVTIPHFPMRKFLLSTENL